LQTTFQPGDRVRIREAALVDGHRYLETQHPALPVGSEGLVLEHATVTGRADGGEELFLVEWDDIGASTYISPRYLESAADGRPADSTRRTPSNASGN
jgi:hypothetical protein